MSEIPFLSARALLRAFGECTLSPVEVVDELAARIDAMAPLGSFYALTLDAARTEARGAERAWSQGIQRQLEGIPFAVKDVFDTRGTRTTYGSPLFDGHLPTRDARAVALAREAGAILLGKTATDEFAFGIAGVNPHYGPARNPWMPDRVSGGSSSGSAVAIAAGLVPLAIGSDTGGSIRAPSSFCGVVGFKGTWGGVPTDGMWPMARTLDHAGPMARTPLDAALFQAILTQGARGSGAARSLVEPLPEGELDIRVGVCDDLTLIPLSPSVRRAFDDAVAVFDDLGCRVHDVSFPKGVDTYGAFVPIRDAESLFTHREAGLFPAHRAGYGKLTYERLAAGEGVQLEDYLVASRERREISEAFTKLFEEIDVLLLPTTTSPPPRIDDEAPDQAAWESLGLHTAAENLLGVPACAVRTGFDELGLPVAAQLVGKAGADACVLAAARALYDATPEVQSRWPDPAL